MSKSIKPAIRWTAFPVCPCEILPDGHPGEVVIDGKPYRVTYNATLPEVGEPHVYGFRFENEDGSVYDIDTTGEARCDCRGFERWNRCKHVEALQKWREQRGG